MIDADTSNIRIGLSLTIAILFHIGFFYMLNLGYVVQKKDMRVISGVELIEQQITKIVPVTVIPEKPKTIFQEIKQIFHPKKEEKIDKPIDIVKETLKEESKKVEEKKLVDKTEQLVRKIDEMNLEELRQKRDEKIVELVKTFGGDTDRIKQLLSQETKLVDKVTVPVRFDAPAIDLEEVGIKKDEKLTDIMPTAVKSVKESPKEIKPAETPLMEKKEMLKKVLAAPEIKIDTKSDRIAIPATQLQEISITKKEREKISELIALQKIIEEKQPSKELLATKSQIPSLGTVSVDRSLKIESKQKDIEPAKIVKIPESETFKKLKVLKTPEKLAEIEKSGVKISGPLKQRKILSAYLPVYPDWAMKKGIECDVTLRFYAAPSGKVKENIVIEITSGYREIDRLCITALQNWLFCSIESERDEWGLITFKFRLK